jgi:hypothetical protein
VCELRAVVTAEFLEVVDRFKTLQSDCESESLLSWLRYCVVTDVNP